MLKKLRDKFINIDEFNEEYNKFKDNVTKLDNFKSKKDKVSVSAKQQQKKRYERDLKNIVDLYNLKSDRDTNKKGEGLKILTNKQKCLIVCLYYSLKYKQEIILNHLTMN